MVTTWRGPWWWVWDHRAVSEIGSTTGQRCFIKTIPTLPNFVDGLARSHDHHPANGCQGPSLGLSRIKSDEALGMAFLYVSSQEIRKASN